MDPAYNMYKSARIDEQAPDSTHLFNKYSHIGDVINKPLDGDLFCQVPLALYKDSSGMLGKDSAYPYKNLANILDSIHLYNLPDNNCTVHAMDVIITWNIMQHFFPYFDVTGTNWDDELTKVLQAALADSSDKAFYIAFRKMMAALKDGHGFTNWQRQPMNTMFLPAHFEQIQDSIVVTETYDSSAFRPGDVLCLCRWFQFPGHYCTR